MKRFPFINSFLFSCLIASSTQLQAAEPNGLMEPTLSCKIRAKEAGSSAYTVQEADLLDTKRHIDRLVSRLRQALFRGDVNANAGVEDASFYAAEIENTLESCAGAPNPYTSANGSPQFACLNKNSRSSLTNKANYSTLYQICDHECHLQLSRFHVFMSGDFLFARNDFKPSANADTLAKEHARLCADPILNRAIDMTSRTLSGKTKKDETQDANAVGIYVRQNFELQTLKLKALMNSGDIDYQNVSGIKLLALMGSVNSAIKGPNGEIKNQSTLLQTAYASYDAALWAAIELRTDLPDTQTDKLATLSNLEAQIRLRIQSIEDGKLFLNLDPDEFTSMPLTTIRSEIEKIESQIKEVQEKVENLRREGVSDKVNLATLEEDEFRTVSSYELNIKTEKIAQRQALLEKRRAGLEEIYGTIDAEILKKKGAQLDIKGREANFKDAIAAWNEEIAALRTGVARLTKEHTSTEGDLASLQEQIEARRQKLEITNQEIEYLNAEQQVLRARFEMSKATTEFANEQRQITHLNEKELIALSRDKAVELQSRYQWLISLTMTKLNLELQFKTLGGQISSAVSRFKSLSIGAFAKKTEYEGLVEEYRILRESMKISEGKIRQLYLRKYFDSAFRQNSLRKKACEFERQLAMIGSPIESGKSYTARVLSQFAEKGPLPAFPTNPLDEKQTSDAFVLFDDSSSRSTEKTQTCYARRFGGDALYAEDKANLTDFDALFDVQMPGDLNPRRLDARVDDAQFPFFGRYALPDSYAPDHVGFAAAAQPFEDSGLDRDLLDGLKKRVDVATKELNTSCQIEPEDVSEKSYLEKMCGKNGVGGLRRTLGTEQKKLNDFIVYCLKNNGTGSAPAGVDCSSVPESEARFARQIYEKHKAAADARKAAIRELKLYAVGVQTLLAEIQTGIVAASATKAAALETLSASITATTSTIVSNTTGACGQGPCAYTTTAMDRSTGMTIKYDTVKEKMRDAIDKLKTGVDVTQIVNEAKVALAGYNSELEQLSFETEKNEIVMDQTLNEIAGSRRQYQLQDAIDQTTRDITIADCNQEESRWNDKVAAVKYQHSQTLDEFDRENAERLSSEMELSQERSRAAQTFSQMKQLNFRIEKLNTEIADLRNQAQESLLQVESNTMQLCLVDDASQSVTDLDAKEKTQKSLVDSISDIYKQKIEAMHDDKVKGDQDLWALTSKYYTENSAKSASILDRVDSKSVELQGQHSLQAAASALMTKAKSILAGIADLELSQAEKTELKTKMETNIETLEKQSVELEKDVLAKETEKSGLKDEFNSFVSSVAGEIVSIRDGLKSDVEGLAKRMQGDGDKTKAVLGAQELFETIYMAVPDYLDRKKELLQRGNEYLNKLRSRINALSLVSNAAPIEDTGYVRTTTAIDRSLEQAFDRLAKSGSNSRIYASTAWITIPPKSAFMLDLVENGQVNFQIAPVSGSNAPNEIKAKMTEKGFLTLWAPEFDRGNVRLLGIRIGTEAVCGNNFPFAGSVRLNVLGVGTILGKDSADESNLPQIVTAKPRSLPGIQILSNVLQDGTSDKLNAWKTLFMPAGGGGLDLQMLEQKRAEDSLSLDLMGSPLSGSYSLVAEEWSSSCLEEVKKSNLQIHFVYSVAK